MMSRVYSEIYGVNVFICHILDNPKHCIFCLCQVYECTSCRFNLTLAPITHLQGWDRSFFMRKYDLGAAIAIAMLCTISSERVLSWSILQLTKLCDDRTDFKWLICIYNYHQAGSNDQICIVAGSSSPQTTKCVYVSHIFPWNTIERPFCAVYYTLRTTSSWVETLDSTSWYICSYINS